MKKFMKFIPVALGMLMLASCSNDDFFGENKVDQYANLGDGDMVVHAPKPLWGGDAVTRALRDFVPNETPIVRYQRTDILRVYDDALTKWDIYEYRQADDQENTEDITSPLAFRRRHVSNLNGPATYALYPKEDVIDADWSYTDEGLNHTHTVATVNIAQKMTYVAGYDRQNDPNNELALYQDRLPQWGQVINSEKGYLESHMEYLTGILCVQLAGVNEYAKWLRVQLIDGEGKALNIAGQAQVELAVNEKLKMAYEEDGLTVIENQAARITTNDFLKGAKQDIIVDMTKDVNLSKEDRQHAKIFVPLACTDVDKEKVCIVVTYSNADKAPTTDEGWDPLWTKCNVVIERGRYYWNDPEINLAIDGTTPCAISDALELMAQTANGKLILTATNPIMITEDCKRIVVPNVEFPVEINLPAGIYGEKSGETLTLVYENPEGEKFPASVTFNAACAELASGTANPINLDVQLPEGTFALVDGCPIQSAKIDAKAFIAGDGETRTNVRGNGLTFSDNVESITVAENAAISYAGSRPYNCELAIPNRRGDEGYTNAGITEININGTFAGYIDARTAEVDITVEPITAGNIAMLFGGARTLGEINAFTKAVLIDPQSVSMESPLQNCSDVYGFAAQNDVTIGKPSTSEDTDDGGDQSFVVGPVFSWKGDILINNKDLNDVDYWLNGGKLSNVIFNRVPFMTPWTFGNENFGYGPLYAEEGSVKIQAKNSKVVVLNKPADDAEVEMLQSMLNEHAQKAVTFAVYAAQDIDLNGDDITVYGKMWAEKDVNLAGKVNCPTRGIFADHDFKIEGESYANYVTVGHNATVDVDEQNGKCKAVGTLIFTENEAEGNALSLLQGYIATVNNGTADAPVEVLLFFSDDPAYAAIGKVAVPDALTPAEGQWSIWNGKMMPRDLWSTYQNFDDIWTATQLAIQLQNPVSGETLRSDIDLNGEKWSGINPTASTYVLHGNDHTIKNINITGRGKIYGACGFINELNGGLEVDNLTLTNVETNIPTVAGLQITGDDLWDWESGELSSHLFGIGALAGYVGEDVELSRVLVILKKDTQFGSNGTTNKLAYGIGGVLGYVDGDINFDGVRVNANNATLNGWCFIGGLVGCADGKVTITNGKTTDKYTEIFKTQVNKLASINVTYIDKRSSNDPQQGKTGLYIGSCNLQNEIYIYSSDDAAKKLTITGLADESKAWDQQSLGRFFFKRGEQTFIGNCGYDDPEPVQYVINNKQYAVDKTASDFKSGFKRLYGLVLEDYVTEWNYGMFVDFQTIP